MTGIKDSAELGIPGCFEVTDKVDTWSVCQTADGEGDTWICAIKTVLGIPCETTPATPVVNKVKIL